MARALSRLSGGAANATSLVSSSSTPPVPGHDNEAHFRIAIEAEHKLQAAADLLADQHGVEPFDPGAPDVVGNAPVGRANRLVIAQMQRNRADIGFVQQLRRDRLQHHRIADLPRGLHGVVGRLHRNLRGRRECHKRASAP